MSSRSLVWFVVGGSLLLSLWGAYAQFIPNPDSMFYLRSAELFQAGRWREGMETFRWPLYSLAIAAVMAVTGASALISAQVVNALFDAATAVLFVALVARLANDNRSVVFWAAFLILLHPKLVQVRPTIIRDHGFYTFLLLALYLVTFDLRSPRLILKIGIALAVFVAALFRPEAAAFFLLIPAFYLFDRATSRPARAGVVVAVLLVCGLLVPAFSLWNFMGAYATTSPGEMLETWAKLTRDMFKVVNQVTWQLENILPRGRNVGGLAYAGIVLAITADVMLRAVTLPIAVLSVLAFSPQRLLSQHASRFIGWFAWWQLPLLLTFMTFALFLDFRYAMAFALLVSIPAAFTLDAAAREAQDGTWQQRLLLVAAIAAVVIAFALAVPRVSNLTYLRDAGRWVRDTLPADARVVTNDARIAYYSGRDYGRQMKNLPAQWTKDDLSEANYFLWHIDRSAVPAVQGVEPSKEVAIFAGTGVRRVIVYRLR